MAVLKVPGQNQPSAAVADSKASCPLVIYISGSTIAALNMGMGVVKAEKRSNACFCPAQCALRMPGMLLNANRVTPLHTAISERALFRRSGSLIDLTCALGLLREVAAGLRFVHDNFGYHGSLTTQSVFWERDSGSTFLSVGTRCQVAAAFEAHAGYDAVGSNFDECNARTADIRAFGMLAWEVLSEVNGGRYSGLDASAGHPAFPSHMPKAVVSMVEACVECNGTKHVTARELEKWLDELVHLAPAMQQSMEDGLADLLAWLEKVVGV